MIVVKVELHSAITGRVSELGRMLIGNDGTGAGKRGNYDVRVLRKRMDNVHEEPFEQWYRAPVTRAGRVEDYPRQSYNVWRLVARALLSAFPEERC